MGYMLDTHTCHTYWASCSSTKLYSAIQRATLYRVMDQHLLFLCHTGRWFAARVGWVKELTIGGVFSGKHISARHDMHPSAASTLIALLHASLERIVVFEDMPHGDRQARALVGTRVSTLLMAAGRAKATHCPS